MKPTTKKLDFFNKALFYDETLLCICDVVENGMPIGPGFLHALSTLIEAAIIHETIFYDPIKYGKPGSPTQILQQSEFIGLLTGEGVFSSFPVDEEIDAFLHQQGRTYRYSDFLVEAGTPGSFYIGSDLEQEYYRVLLDLIQHAPILLEPQPNVPENPDSDYFRDDDCSALVRMAIGERLGYSKQDLSVVLRLNYRAEGYLNLAKSLGLSLHPFLPALPYQVEGIVDGNKRAFEIYHRINQAIRNLDDNSNEITEFSRISVPPLCRLVLKNCKNSGKSIAVEILNLRYATREFRRYMTEFERKWERAESLKERKELKNEMENGWSALVKKDEQPATRFTYRLWDVVKDPTKILEKLGDLLTQEGRQRFVINRVGGLHDFWDELCGAPPSRSTRPLLTAMFPKQVDEATWDLAKGFAEALNSRMTKPTQA